MTRSAALASLADLESQASALPGCTAWQDLSQHARAMASVSLRSLLDSPGRYPSCTIATDQVRLDYSRQRVTDQTLALLLELAKQRNLSDWVTHLFAGEPVNGTERRPALHMALRSRGGRVFAVNGTDVMPAVRRELQRVLRLAGAIGAGEYRGHTGEPITDIVNIGIGGSDLGLVMAVEALAPYRNPALRTHFVSNIDGTQLTDILRRLDPARALFIICSKSFTTLETQLNAEAARRWFISRLPEAAVARHFLAVSVNDPAMDRFGIPAENRFRIWDWVGGRYSLWSSVGLTIAMALGPDHFEELLEGACAMDEHFRESEPAANLPVVLGLLGVWNQNFCGIESHAVLPYTQRLHRLPAFLQQLEMESNGKGVCRDGRPVQWRTGTVVWGEPGSNAQHAFFQLLHQGTAPFSADFIAPVRRTDGGPAEQHLSGLANMLAQAEAFARGRTEAEVLTELQNTGLPEARARELAPQKVHGGNHPNSIILLNALDPGALGHLVALYEHKVFVQSVIWGINPFDQWGVELGKTMAGPISAALTGDGGSAVLPGIAGEIRRAAAHER